MNEEQREEMLHLLEQNSRISLPDLAAMLGLEEETVKQEVKKLEEEKIIGGYRTEIDWDRTDEDHVTAMIGVKISLQRGQGFDKIAMRISRFDEVKSVHLISGSSADLILTIEGKNLREISRFVYTKIAPMESVESTATYFVLRKYKDNGVILGEDKDSDERIQIMP